MQAGIVSNVYKFLLYSVFLAKSRGDQLLLAEIISVCDKIAAMIELVFSGQNLQTGQLVYHYLVYELQELKDDFIN